MESKPIILIVDDMPPVLEALASLLETENCQIVLASDGPSALARVVEHAPDIILLDVMMPGMDGYEVARRLRADARWRHIPIIFVTALDSTADLVHGLEAGADEFLSKPVNGLELRARVRSMLRLKRQYDELAANLRLREDLANMIAHDMRTPLTLILSNTESLSHETALPPTLQASLEAVGKQAQRLNAFLTDMLLLAKMEAGQLRLDYAVLDVNQLVREAAQNYLGFIQARGRKLVLELAETPCPARLDAKLLARVLDNLLSNALKFSPPGGAITMRVAGGPAGEAASRVQVQVIDQGPGIPPEHRTEIFNKFSIVELKQRSLPQIGLGLAFCKLVVEAHGGQIGVEENQPQGAIFKVELSREPDPQSL